MSYNVLSAQFTRSSFSAFFCHLSPHGKVLILCIVSSDPRNQSYSTVEFQLSPHGKALEYKVLSSQISPIAHCTVISVDTEGSPSAHCTVSSLPKEQTHNKLPCQLCPHGAAWKHSVLSAQSPQSSPIVHCTFSKRCKRRSFNWICPPPPSKKKSASTWLRFHVRTYQA